MSAKIYETAAENRVVYREFNTITEAEMFKSILDSAGIWSMITNEYMSAVYPMAITPQLIIREEDLERVKALIVD